MPSNWLSADSVARLVTAAIVEARLADEPAVAPGVVLALAAKLEVAAVGLLTLVIDIMNLDRDCSNQGYRPGFAELE